MLQETEAGLATLVNAILLLKQKKLRRQDTDFIEEVWRGVQRKIADLQYFAEQQMSYLGEKRLEIASDIISGPVWIRELLILQYDFDAALQERNVKEMADLADQLLDRSRAHLQLVDSRLFKAMSASD